MSRISKDELLLRVKAQIREVTAEEVQARLEAEPRPLLLDVRESDEVAAGKLAGARHIPRGFLELRIEGVESHRDAEIIVYCGGDARSALAARALAELGYTNVASLKHGFTGWKNRGLPWVVDRTLTPEQQIRYARHLSLKEVGAEGQHKLLEARVLLVGAGGLGSPTALYLAAAGVGTIGVVDPDIVDRSNLQRQILHRDQDIGVPKVDSAERAMLDLNPDVRVVKYAERLSSQNVMRILDAGWDVVIDGCDNFPTRYLVNDACVFRRLPNVHGSIFRFEGQVSVFAPHIGGPCYRCLYPEPPPPGVAPSCAEAGVIGALPGVIGTMQAIEAIKLTLGAGRSLIGRLLQYDALEQSWQELRLRRDPKCRVCSERPTITELVDYEAFCHLAG
ncbi:MAG: molybdopterin-synthase adenylyltransferase MoeB [Deltaproteobacteria bacterium]|nr:molybdopterin-synthase adenylyltransferase MoeB [Deltaproteobacteria bacterium]